MYKIFFIKIILIFVSCAGFSKVPVKQNHKTKIKNSQKILYLKQALYNKAITQSEYDSLYARLINPAMDIDFFKVLEE
ncbi:MAG: hypothetical protein CMG74_09790 [Candidatus Marinimicrobia bacterium]|nr:hypothetical protein [Candidatus Neomarinimicrobiota bacterium]